MYKIIGADGQHYGPATAEQVREWIATHRANAQTQAQAEGATDWKPLSAFPEFADALAAKPPPLAGLLPRVDAVDPEALAAQILGRDYTLDIAGCLGRAWDLVMSDFWPIVGVSALVFALVFAANSVWIGLILNGPLLGGWYWFALKRIRSGRAGLPDAFAGFSSFSAGIPSVFLQTMLGALVASLLASVGLLFCLLPGIYLGVAWKFTLALIMDKHLEFWDAMEVSRKVVTRHWWHLFALLLLSALLNLAGLLCCCVGLFVTIPVTVFALMYAYEDVFGAAQSQSH